MRYLGFMLTVAGTALNVGLYADDGNPWNLGSAVFCGFVSVYVLVVLVRSP